MASEKTQEELQKENTQLSEAIKKSEEDLKAAMELNAELQSKLEATKAAGKSKNPTVKIDKQNYEIAYAKAMVPVNGKMIVMTSEQIAADKELCKSLIESGSKILKAIK